MSSRPSRSSCVFSLTSQLRVGHVPKRHLDHVHELPCRNVLGRDGGHVREYLHELPRLDAVDPDRRDVALRVCTTRLPSCSDRGPGEADLPLGR